MTITETHHASSPFRALSPLLRDGQYCTCDGSSLRGTDLDDSRWARLDATAQAKLSELKALVPCDSWLPSEYNGEASLISQAP